MFGILNRKIENNLICFFDKKKLSDANLILEKLANFEIVDVRKDFDILKPGRREIRRDGFDFSKNENDKILKMNLFLTAPKVSLEKFTAFADSLKSCLSLRMNYSLFNQEISNKDIAIVNYVLKNSNISFNHLNIIPPENISLNPKYKPRNQIGITDKVLEQLKDKVYFFKRKENGSYIVQLTKDFNPFQEDDRYIQKFQEVSQFLQQHLIDNELTAEQKPKIC